MTPEFVRSVWDKVVDMSKTEHLNTIGEASGSLFNVLENLKASSGNGANAQEVVSSFSYGCRDIALYNLGIGVSVSDPDDLKFLYEQNADFAPLPSFFIQPGLISSMESSLIASAITHKEINLAQVKMFYHLIDMIIVLYLLILHYFQF